MEGAGRCTDKVPIKKNTRLRSHGPIPCFSKEGADYGKKTIR